MTGKNHSSKFLRFVSTFASEFKPFAAQDREGKDIYVDDAELIRIIAKYFGARYEILTPPGGEYGARLPDGNWTGMIGMVQREEVDLAMSGLVMTLERYDAVNYSYPYHYSTLNFMTDAPEPMPTSSAIFHPFSLTLWMALVLLTAAMSFVFYVLLGGRQPYQKVMLSTFRSTLENAVDFKMKKKPALKMAAFAWILGMFVVTSGYKSVLLSFLSFPTMVGIRDISQLSAAAATRLGSFKCITFSGSYAVQDFEKRDDPSWKTIGDCLVRNEMPGDALENFVAAPRGKAFVGSKFFMAPYVRRYFVSEDSFFIEQRANPFSRTFCCPEDLNRIVHRLFATGVLEKIWREIDFWEVLRNPSLTPEHSEASRAISLVDMSFAFYILMAGWSAGFITLSIEVVKRKYIK